MDFLDKYNFDLTYYFWIFVVVLGVLLLIQILYYLLIYKKPYSYENKQSKDEDTKDKILPSVSVVIASKNESENLAKNLPLILEQDYPDFEVIVVNMGSTDETDIELKRLSLKYPNLYHTFVPSDAEDFNGKKLALTLGIKAANNEVLLFTEIYCAPTSNKWISEFAKEFSKGRDIVLGYSMLDIKQRFLMRGFVKYDSLIHQMKFLSMAIWGKPFMGINRNLAYRKSLFFEEKGFSSVLTFEDGEDDLFINQVSKNRNVGVVTSKDSMTITDIVISLSKWKSLKEKYIYNKRYYNGSARFVFGLESLTKYLFYIAVALSVSYGIMTNNYAPVLLGVIAFIIRYFVTFHVLNRLDKLFESGKLHINFIIYELLQPFSNYKLRKRANKRRYVR